MNAGKDGGFLVKAGADLRLMFPNKDPDQVRSFRYFLNVAAPSLAGSFSTRFWTEQIPLACHDDPAIWHAVVSLGSVYEDYSTLVLMPKEKKLLAKNLFALKQFNQAVQCLTKSGEDDHKAKWRALIMSTIFTCICEVEGLHDQAKLHFSSGCKLLREVEAEEYGSESQTRPIAVEGSEKPARNPVSVAAVRSVLAGLEMRTTGMDSAGLKPPKLLSPDDRSYNAWQTYTAPKGMPEGRALTLENLTNACQAAESLMYTQIMFSKQHENLFMRLYIERTKELMDQLALYQRPMIHCFRELHKGVRACLRELEVEKKKQTGMESRETAQLRLLLAFVRLYICANRLFIVPFFVCPDMDPKYAHFEIACITAVEVAEEICSLEAALKMRCGQAPLAPNPPLSAPLSIVAVVAPTNENRLRATELLRRPRLEGFFDGALVASVAEAIMKQEAAADSEYLLRKQLEGVDLDPPLKGVQPDAERTEVHPLSRSYTSTFVSTVRRDATIEIKTWRDLLQGKPGAQVEIAW